MQRSKILVILASTRCLNFSYFGCSISCHIMCLAILECKYSFSNLGFRGQYYKTFVGMPCSGRMFSYRCLSSNFYLETSKTWQYLSFSCFFQYDMQLFGHVPGHLWSSPTLLTILLASLKDLIIFTNKKTSLNVFIRPVKENLFHPLKHFKK